MFPILFQVGPLTIYSWGLSLVFAYIVGSFILWREGKRQGYNEEKLLDLSIIALVAALVGGRLSFVLLNWTFFREEAVRALFFWEGGFAYWGAFLLVLLVSWYFIRVWKWSFFQIADIGSISITSSLVVGKLGAFLAGLDYGKVTSLPWAVSFPNLVGSRHPIQLYEAFAYFLLFLLLYFIYHRNLTATNMKSGKVFFTFLILSSLIRAALEFFRAQSLLLWVFPVSSLISVAVALISVFALYYFKIRNFRDDSDKLTKKLGISGATSFRRIRS